MMLNAIGEREETEHEKQVSCLFQIFVVVMFVEYPYIEFCPTNTIKKNFVVKIPFFPRTFSCVAIKFFFLIIFC